MHIKLHRRKINISFSAPYALALNQTKLNASYTCCYLASCLPGERCYHAGLEMLKEMQQLDSETEPALDPSSCKFTFNYTEVHWADSLSNLLQFTSGRNLNSPCFLKRIHPVSSPSVSWLSSTTGGWPHVSSEICNLCLSQTPLAGAQFVYTSSLENT